MFRALLLQPCRFCVNTRSGNQQLIYVTSFHHAIKNVLPQENTSQVHVKLERILCTEVLSIVVVVVTPHSLFFFTTIAEMYGEREREREEHSERKRFQQLVTTS